MIQPQDLRIGNWVRQRKSEVLVQVKEVLTTRILIKVGAPLLNIKSYTVPLIHYEGIPLTPELLEKCGFVKTALGYDSSSEFNIYCHPKHANHYYPCYKENMASSNMIKSLHQLQNLYYCLTGKELEITF